MNYSLSLKTQELRISQRKQSVLCFLIKCKRRIFHSKLRCYPAVKHLFLEKTGLEIGGPSAVFARGGILPLYPIVNRLDNCNYSETTVWGGTIKKGYTFVFDYQKMLGMQYILEATDLSLLQSENYDFALSSHILEHSANPLRALSELHRILKEAGVLVIVLPHMESTFDHRRSVTSFEHLIKDYNNNTTEDDLTHLTEILSSHDLAMDVEAGDFNAFKSRSLRNSENRCLHQHVFNTQLGVEIINWLGMQIIAVEPVFPHHIFIIAKKQKESQLVQNSEFFGKNVKYRKKSPFFMDHI